MTGKLGLKREKNWAVWLLSLPIRAYRYFISPLVGPHCRFHPTCSSYCLQALQQQGVLRGGYLGFKRLLKCHPGNAGGYDPVPESLPCEKNKRHRKLCLKTAKINIRKLPPDVKRY